MSQPRCFYYQSGGSIGDVGPLYKRGYFVQRGHGLSDIFSNFIRFLSPYVKGASKALGKQALTSGINIIEGLQKDEPIKEILMKERDRGLRNLAMQASDSLKNMQGRGRIKRRRVGFSDGSSVSLPKRRRRSSSVRKLKKKSVRKSNKKTKSSRRKTKSSARKGKSKRKRKVSKKKSSSVLKADILNQFMK